MVNLSPSRESPKAPRLLFPCLLIFVAALAVRLPYALTRPVPMSVDAAYYTMVAENLYHGRGFVSDYVWNYLAGLPTSLPVPSNEYWMPDTSLVTAAAFALTRSTSPRVAQMQSLLLGALLCAITTWIGGLLFRRRDVALLAGALGATSVYLVDLALYPDHFMLNAVLVNLSLLALWSAWRGRPPLALAAGALAGLAYLTRTDGALLAIVTGALAIDLSRRGEGRRGLVTLLCFLAAFVLVGAPWWARQTLVFGSPSGANPLRTAFLTKGYNDLFRLDQSRLNLRDYLQTSQVYALLFKGYVLYYGLRILTKSVLLVGVLAVLSLFTRHCRRPALPWLIYFALGTVVPPLLVPYPAIKGGLWHLLPGLIPIILVLGAAGAFHIRDWAKRSSSPALRLAAWAAIVLSLGSPLYWWLQQPRDAKREQRSLYPAVAGAAVRDLGPAPPPVLTDSAWGLYFVARIPCAQFPTDGAEAALQVADALGAAYLITRANPKNDRVPASQYMMGIVSHPRFHPLTRYRHQEGDLLLYRILPPEQPPAQSPSASRRSMSQYAPR